MKNDKEMNHTRSEDVKYADVMIRMIIITGFSDRDILQEVLGADNKSLEDTIFLLSVTWKDKTEQESKVEKLETENLELKKVI